MAYGIARDLKYKSESRQRSQLYQLLGGFDYQASGSSSVEALIGGYYREFEDSRSESGFSWRFTGVWSPRNDFVMRLESAQQFNCR